VTAPQTAPIPGPDAGAIPALYPIRVTHLHRSPVHHYAEHRTYSWYVDIDDLPRLPRWLRPFARFEASDHLQGRAHDTLRHRVDAFLAAHGVFLPGGRVTALLMPRVLGRAFNPLSLFWCHDSGGRLRCVIAEVHSPAGDRQAYLLPPGEDGPVAVTGALPHAPFSGADGYFLVRTPRPGGELDLAVSLHRDDHAAMVATWRGKRRRATVAQILRLQLSSPLAPHVAELNMRFQAAMLRPALGPARARDQGWSTGPASGSRWRAPERSWAAS